MEMNFLFVIEFVLMYYGMYLMHTRDQWTKESVLTYLVLIFLGLCTHPLLGYMLTTCSPILIYLVTKDEEL